MSEPTAADQARWEKWDDLRARKEAATTDEEREALKQEEQALREEGMKELFFQEIKTDPTWWWLSFVDPERPEGDQFLGVAIVPGSGVLSAALMARALGCNPGGEVKGIPIPSEHVPAAEFLKRLLSKQEIVEAGL